MFMYHVSFTCEKESSEEVKGLVTGAEKCASSVNSLVPFVADCGASGIFAVSVFQACPYCLHCFSISPRTWLPPSVIQLLFQEGSDVNSPDPPRFQCESPVLQRLVQIH